MNIKVELEEVPECWELTAETAINRVWKLFQLDQKTILTENDLKCWLFTELNLLKFCEESFVVHTEATHYSRHLWRRQKRYTFRDLSLLNPQNIRLNNQLYGFERSLSKGFLHRGKALHFELKFSRQPVNINIIPALNLNDLQKINAYQPNVGTPQRKFICLIGSQNPRQNLQNDLLQTIRRLIQNNLNLVRVYYFDRGQLIKYWFENGQCMSNLWN